MRIVISVITQPAVVIYYGTMSFAMLCTIVQRGEYRSLTPLEMFWRSLLWWKTFFTLTDRGHDRFERIAFAGVITGWLWNLVYFQVNKYRLPLWYALLIWEAIMFLITVCIYTNASKKEPLPTRTILLYGVCWFYAIPKWLLSASSRKAMQYREAVWAKLITGWLIVLFADFAERSNGLTAFAIKLACYALLTWAVYQAGSNHEWFPGTNVLRLQSAIWFGTLPYWYYKGELRIIDGPYRRRVWNTLLVGWALGIAIDSERQIEMLYRLVWFGA